jgi:hypothetical protein
MDHIGRGESGFPEFKAKQFSHAETKFLLPAIFYFMKNLPVAAVLGKIHEGSCIGYRNSSPEDTRNFIIPIGMKTGYRQICKAIKTQWCLIMVQSNTTSRAIAGIDNTYKSFKILPQIADQM